MPPEFPKAPSNFESHFRLAPQPIENELTCFASRIEKHQDDIFWAIEAFEILNGYLQSDELIDAIAIAAEIEQCTGCSFFLLAKITYIYSRVPNGSAEKEICGNWLSKYGLSGNNVVAISLADTMGETYSLFSVRKNILGIDEREGQRRFTVDLAKFVHIPLAEGADEFHNNFQSFLQSSLIDAVFYFCIHRYNLSQNSFINIPDLIGSKIDEMISTPWASIAKKSYDFTELINPKKEHGDHVFFRQSIAWIEVSEVTNYRKLVDQYYREPDRPKRLIAELCPKVGDGVIRRHG